MFVQNGYLFGVLKRGLSDRLMLGRNLKEERAGHKDNVRKAFPGAQGSTRLLWNMGMEPVWSRQQGRDSGRRHPQRSGGERTTEGLWSSKDWALLWSRGEVIMEC